MRALPWHLTAWADHLDRIPAGAGRQYHCIRPHLLRQRTNFLQARAVGTLGVEFLRTRMFRGVKTLVYSSRCFAGLGQRLLRKGQAASGRLLSSPAASVSDDSIQLEVIRDMFHSYARTDPSKAEPFLSIEDLRDMLLSIGDHPSDERLRHIIDAIDKDASGTVELNEFMEGYHTVLGGEHDAGDNSPDTILMDDVLRTFRNIDRNGDGVLDMEELANLLTATGGHIGNREAREILELADTDKNGVIDLSEFIAFFANEATRRPYSWRLRSGFRAAFVVGGPKSGTKSLCERLVQSAEILSCDVGEILKEEVETGSPLGKKIATTLANDWLVPSSTSMALLRKKLSRLPGSFVAIRGFPRYKRNCRDFEKICGVPEFSVYIDTPEEIIIERLLEEKPDQLAIDIQEAEAHANAFLIMVEPMLEHLEKSGVTVHRLDGCGSSDDIWEELLSLEPLVRNRCDAGILSCFSAL
uniref:EF-hand domain-containing protein n=1 Tax=Odontella aurita TaxID=265563 RepID=A0A7S4HV10_9STRA|mmetsp:Transcript_15548/g.44936  ORF Transcript_15548/g.44936 Transcript_15548/m.44936 type:complete len:470 (+) Transcript_15548:112-1521(+)